MTPQELRQEVANVASREIDCADPARYWREVLPRDWRGPYPPHWCGAFALWCLHAALGCDWHWEIGKGFLWRLRRTDDPDLGDICYLDKPYQHHAVLTAVGENDHGRYVISVDGNSGMPPTRVDEHWRRREKWTAIYSIQPLVDAALSQS